MFKRKPQEKAGTYTFSGKASITSGAQDVLSPDELVFILGDVQAFARSEDGIDYLQVYEHEDGRRIWCIDQLNRQMKESGDYTPEQIEEFDHWTILLPEEH